MQLVHAAEDGVALHAAALASGFEGVIGKRKDSRYEAGPALGVVAEDQADAERGFRRRRLHQGQGLARAARARCWSATGTKGKLRYASHVGSGFDERTLAQVKARLEPLRREHLPVRRKAGAATARRPGSSPKLVAEVSFQSWTEDGSLRAPVFLRLRDDVDPKSGAPRRRRAATPAARSATPRAGSEIDDVVRAAREHEGRLHARGRPAPDPPHASRSRLLARRSRRCKQPALTKRDLLRYFAQVSPFILPHLADRPLTMIRMPDGIDGQRFFQKHWEQERPEFVETITVFSEHKDEQHEYLLCNNLPTLLWLAQSGTLEFHVWHSRAKLGPDAASQEHRLRELARGARRLGAQLSRLRACSTSTRTSIPARRRTGAEPELNTVAFEKGKEVAFWLRELLQSMSLEPIVKTSGKTGLHVFVPIRRTIDFDAARHVSELVGPAPDAPAPEGHHAGVERAQADRQDLHGLQHERPRQDAERRLLAARRAGRAGVDAADVGRARGRAPARLQDHERAAAPGADGRSLAATR